MGGLCGMATALVWTLRPIATDSPPVVLPATAPLASSPEETPPPPSSDDTRSHAFRVPTRGGAAARMRRGARGRRAGAHAARLRARTRRRQGVRRRDGRLARPVRPVERGPGHPGGRRLRRPRRATCSPTSKVAGRGTVDGCASSWAESSWRGWTSSGPRSTSRAPRPRRPRISPQRPRHLPSKGATVTRPARALAATLGRHVGAIELAIGPAAHPYVDAARARYFPSLDADGWARVDPRLGRPRVRSCRRSRTAHGRRSTKSRACTRSTSRRARRRASGTSPSARRSA